MPPRSSASPARHSARSTVHRATFGSGRFGSARLLRDQAQVELHLPAATRHLEVDGARGWLYPVRTEAGDADEPFLWFDGGAYQVKVVSPPLEDHPGAHACHLFPGGRSCLGTSEGGGMPTLVEAFTLLDPEVVELANLSRTASSTSPARG